MWQIHSKGQLQKNHPIIMWKKYGIVFSREEYFCNLKIQKIDIEKYINL